MATQRKKKRFIIRFELGWFGIFSLGVVSFCIFFWMFLLGIWAGQTILQPNGTATNSPFAKLTSSLQGKGEERQEATVAGPAGNLAEQAREIEEGTSEWPTSEPSFFALQVAAFRDPARAQKSVGQWRGRGYQAFSAPPEDKDDPFTRVYVGKFDKLVDANGLAARLEKQENTKAFIALLPASRIELP